MIPGFDPKNPFPDFGKMLEQIKVPGVDVGRILEAQRKDIEALQKANQAAVAGVQELARRQTEILQEAIAEWQGAMARAAAPAKQAELAQQAFGKAFADMRELAEMTTRSQQQAWEAVQDRFQQHLEEFRKLMQSK